MEDTERFCGTRSPVRRGRDCERGAVLVETVLTFPLVAMLVFGMISTGIALGQKNSIENAAREASRFGATYEVTASTADWLDDVSDAAVSAATGELDTGAPGRYVCVALVGTGGSDGRKIISGESPSYDAGSCPGMSCASSLSCVQILLQRDGQLDAVFFRRALTLKASSVSVFERG